MKADIYTRGGDAGQTSLLGGVRVDKDDLRVDAYGTLDEMTSCLGVARTAVQDDALCREIIDLQGELIPLMSEVATPAGSTGAASRPIVGQAQVERLERLIDHYDTQWVHTGQFIRPGGAPGSAALDLARAICRRAERRLVALGRVEPVNPVLIKFVNRLSDLLYVFARVDEQSAIRATAQAMLTGASGAQDVRMPLPLHETEAMIQRGMRRAFEIGVPMVLAIVDANGDVIQIRRMDGALIVSVTLAPHKAYTAAIVRLPTAQLAAAAQPGQSLFGIDVSLPKLTLVGGGLPIVKDGAVVGGVGVSGGTVEQDVDVAQAMLG
ncbi:MAG TPA: cob(I)yrinic acid a,c-diamide adenosyltransferase [Anaerolineales bacterium]|nr:cob(I)yrinic acid a,c-diamide adenosyltransferase [Anaerolineales bacterium]